MNWKRLGLRGWGRTTVADTAAFRAERRGEVEQALRDPGRPGGLVAFGGGRSYGDAALNSGGATILTERLDRLISFSEDGLLVCEAGVTFRDIMATFLSRGWSAPVSPGTAFATIGGAIANDVHGKNHDHAGSFGDHLAFIRLALPNGDLVEVSPDDDADLFDATIGGVGLTGVITEAAIRLTRVSSSSVVVKEERAPNIAALMAGLRRARETATYTVAWIDAVAKGSNLGRGILQSAEYAPAGLEPSEPAKSRRFPFDLPGFVLNPLTIGLFNGLYYGRVPAEGRERTMPLGTFLYPLDAILDWNRLYGKRGFHQFQCVVPEGVSDRAIPALLEAIVADGSGSFLAVLKTLGPAGRGPLSFPLPGFTLALDFPARAGTPSLMARLEQLTLEHGGRIYLAKDTCLSPAGFRQMYPRLPAFQDVLDRVDPDQQMTSDLARRLRIRERS